MERSGVVQGEPISKLELLRILEAYKAYIYEAELTPSVAYEMADGETILMEERDI
jgi:hypothetical protein